VHSIRGDTGILVVAQGGVSSSVNTGLEAGDIVRAIDRTPLQSTSQLMAMIRPLRSGDPVVLQIERDGKLQYLAFEIE
jgi:S1-C subfamily serine protease